MYHSRTDMRLAVEAKTSPSTNDNSRPFYPRTGKQEKQWRPNKKKHKPSKKKKSSGALSAKSYQSYMNSHKWRNRRRRFYAGHPNWCFLCGSKEEVVLHHLTYERLGIEEDKDLMPLCKSHHTEFHEFIGGSKLNMVAETFLFIDSKREEYAIDEVMRNLTGGDSLHNKLKNTTIRKGRFREKR